MNQPPDPFEFLKNLWGPMGLPLGGAYGPTLIPDEIERRIAELKSVENWLNMNLNVLRLTIQAWKCRKPARRDAERCGRRAPGLRTGGRSRRSLKK